MSVSVPDRLPTTPRPLPGTRHVRPTPTAAARLALARRQQSAATQGRPFRADLDPTVTAQNRIFVRGRGINAELGGDLRLQGTTQDPIAIGAFELRRGRFDILGKRLDLSVAGWISRAISRRRSTSWPRPRPAMSPHGSG